MDRFVSLSPLRLHRPGHPSTTNPRRVHDISKGQTEAMRGPALEVTTPPAFCPLLNLHGQASPLRLLTPPRTLHPTGNRLLVQRPGLKGPNRTSGIPLTTPHHYARRGLQTRNIHSYLFWGRSSTLKAPQDGGEHFATGLLDQFSPLREE